MNIVTEPLAETSSTFPITVNFPELAEGEKFVGAIISADLSKREVLIMLPDEFKGNWDDAMAWAASIGGELPDRCESALLFATMKNEFRPEFYWTREQRAVLSDYAWYQFFDSGSQFNGDKSNSRPARAFRRLKIL